MSEWKQKRFWTEVSVAPHADGFVVLLDGRQVKTPAKTLLVLPTRALAEAVAAEWAAQDKTVDPLSMPATRSANAALDKVTPQFAEVADMLSEYGDSDLLCYRADAPQELVERQAQHWDAALEWAAQALEARLMPRQGVLHAPQDPQVLERLRARVHEFDPFQLAAFHDLVGISGSLVLALAVTQGWRSDSEIWELSRLDERWQQEQWGADEEAQEVEARKQAEFLHAASFFRLASERD